MIQDCKSFLLDMYMYAEAVEKSCCCPALPSPESRTVLCSTELWLTFRLSPACVSMYCYNTYFLHNCCLFNIDIHEFHTLASRTPSNFPFDLPPQP